MNILMGFPLSKTEGTSWYVFVISILLCVERGEQGGAGRSKATWSATNVPKFNTRFHTPPHPSDCATLLSSSLMAHSRLGIRPYVPADLNEVRLTITKSIMEPLAVANQRSASGGSARLRILTTLSPRLLPPVHNCSMGCVVVCVC